MDSRWEDWRARVVAAEPGTIALGDECLQGLSDTPDAIERARSAIDGFWELLAADPRLALAEVLLAHHVAHRCASALRAPLALRHATGLFVLGRAAAAASVIADELHHHPRGKPSSQRTRLLALQGKVLLVLGEIGPALVCLEEALATTRTHGPPAAMGSVLSALGNARLLCGDLVSAAEYYGDALELAQRHSNLEGVAVGLGNRGLVRHLSGRLEAASVDYEAALEQARANGDRRSALPLLANLGLLASERGALDESRKHLDAALELALAMGDAGSAAACRVRLASVARESGAPDRASELLDEAHTELEQAGESEDERGGLRRMAWWLERGRVALASGDVDEALEVFERARARGAVLGHMSGEAWARCEAARALLLRCSTVGGSPVDLLRELDELVEVASDLAQPLLRGTVQLARAVALLDEGSRELALSALERAEARLPRDSLAATRAAHVRARWLEGENPAAAHALRADLRALAHSRGWGAILRELDPPRVGPEDVAGGIEEEGTLP